MRKSNYDKSPSTTVDGALWKGWESVLDKLKDVCNVPEELARKVVVIECYHGVYLRNWLNTWQHCILL